MTQLTLGVFGTSHKENEFRLPIHPHHFGHIAPAVRRSIFLEEGYGSRFGTEAEELADLVGGMRSQRQLLEECDVILLPKPRGEDLLEMKEGQVLWGWPHCVQDEKLAQNAIDRKLTLIAWEAMNLWAPDGTFNLHVFHKNNELAGYSSVLHALQLMGLTGQYGRPLRAAVISFGATARGAVTALAALGIYDVTVLSQREPAQVASPVHSATSLRFEADDDDASRMHVIEEDGSRPMTEVLAEHDIIVNCVFQDPLTPLMFVSNDDLDVLPPGTLIIDVSCDEGMGFEFGATDNLHRPDVHRRARRQLLRGRPQSVAAVERVHVGDQRGAAWVSPDRDGRTRCLGRRRDDPKGDRDPRRGRSESEDPDVPEPLTRIPARTPLGPLGRDAHHLSRGEVIVGSPNGI